MGVASNHILPYLKDEYSSEFQLMPLGSGIQLPLVRFKKAMNMFQLIQHGSGIQSPACHLKKCQQNVSVDATWEWHPIKFRKVDRINATQAFQLMPHESGIQLRSQAGEIFISRPFQLMPLESGIQLYSIKGVDNTLKSFS